MMYNIDKEVNKMAQQLSPQGYIYGEEPYSEHPFWEHEHTDANIEPITITPTNEQQVIEATALIDGYAPITVEPAPSSEPVIEPLSVTLTNEQQVITAPSGVDGYSPVTIPAAPTPTQPVIQSLSITPSSQQQVITAPSGVDGYSPITVAAVPSANLQSIQVSPELEELYLEPEPPYTGFSDVTVDAAIPFSMVPNNSLVQCYYMGQTSLASAEPMSYDETEYLGAAESIVGTYEIYYFVAPALGSTAAPAFTSAAEQKWQTAADFQSGNDGSLHVYAYYRGSAQGSYSIHTII